MIAPFLKIARRNKTVEPFSIVKCRRPKFDDSGFRDNMQLDCDIRKTKANFTSNRSSIKEAAVSARYPVFGIRQARPRQQMHKTL